MRDRAHTELNSLSNLINPACGTGFPGLAHTELDGQEGKAEAGRGHLAAWMPWFSTAPSLLKHLRLEGRKVPCPNSQSRCHITGQDLGLQMPVALGTFSFHTLFHSLLMKCSRNSRALLSSTHTHKPQQAPKMHYSSVPGEEKLQRLEGSTRPDTQHAWPQKCWSVVRRCVPSFKKEHPVAIRKPLKCDTKPTVYMTTRHRTSKQSSEGLSLTLKGNENAQHVVQTSMKAKIKAKPRKTSKRTSAHSKDKDSK